MKKYIIGLSLSILCCNCAIISINNQREEMINKIQVWRNNNKIKQECPNGGTQSNCGLIFETFLNKNYISKFRGTVCPPLTEEECDKKFITMVYSRLQQRYFKADFNKFNRFCDAYPENCTSIEHKEIILLELHNQGIDEEANNAIVEINNVANQQLEEVRNRIAIGINGGTVCTPVNGSVFCHTEKGIVNK